MRVLCAAIGVWILVAGVSSPARSPGSPHRSLGEGGRNPAYAQGSTEPQQKRLAPYLATPPDVVDRMLKLAGTGPGDFVYDLGSGDGRIVIAAARAFGARGVGVEIDEELVARARANARAAGVEDRVTFRAQDALTVDVSEATVVTLYLLAASNVRLRPILTAQLKPGARIVAHDFPMGAWEPEVIDTFTDAAGTMRTLYLWTADGTVRP